MESNRDKIDSEVFAILKPACVNLALKPNKQTADNFKAVLGEVSVKVLQNQTLYSYVIFPVELHLQNNLNHGYETLCHLVSCKEKVLSLARVDSLDKFLKAFVMLFSLVACEEEPHKLRDVPEELKLSVVTCVIQLILSTQPEVFLELYHRKYYPRLSFGVYLCTQIARNEQLVKLRVQAMECLLALCHVHDSADSTDCFLRSCVLHTVMLMLPGIVSTCAHIATASRIQHHSITLMAVRLWSRVVALVMEDDDGDNGDREPDASQPKSKHFESNMWGKPSSGDSREAFLSGMLKQDRTRKWLVASDKQLANATKLIVSTRQHEHWRVRLELANGVQHLLRLCSRNLEASVSELVDSLIILSQDRMAAVQAAGRSGVQWYRERCQVEGSDGLVGLLEENLYGMLTRLPRLLNANEEGTQLSGLRLVEGYILLLGRVRLPQLLSSAQHCHRLLASLLYAARLDSSHISLLHDATIRELDGCGARGTWCRLEVCRSRELESKLSDVCLALAHSAELALVVRPLLQVFTCNVTQRPQAACVLNMLLNSGPIGWCANESDLLKEVLSAYMEPQVWHTPVSVGLSQRSSSQQTVSIAEAQHNVVLVCLLAEGVGKIALAMGNENFNVCLLSTLYPLLEKAGSPMYAVASAGLTGLKDVAECFGCTAVAGLVVANIDYLTHHITLRLRHPNRHLGVLSVLAVVMQHAVPTVFPSLNDIIHDVLRMCCDSFQECNVDSYLQVFYQFTRRVHSWFPNKAGFNNKVIGTKSNVVDELLEYQRCYQLANSFQNVDDDDLELEPPAGFQPMKNEESEFVMKQEEKKKIPGYIELTVAILNRSLHYLPTKDITRQILVLQIVSEGVKALRCSSEQLLPVVHKVWSPLVERFRASNDSLLVHRAVELLTLLSQTAKDFIAARTLKDVLPSLRYILTQSASESRLKDTGSAYRLTQRYKLQLCLLRSLGKITVQLELQERDTCEVLSAATPYLSSQQPAELQIACHELFRQVSSVNPDLVWLHLYTISPLQETFDHSNSRFTKYRVPRAANDEYKHNVMMLLDEVG